MTIPRQLAPTMGLSHDGFEFLKGNFEGIKGYTMGRMTKSRRGKLYIDDTGRDPEAGSIEYGYRVPFGGIHVFIGKVSEPGPELDICTDIIETAQRARPARVQPAMNRAFVGFVHGVESEDKLASGDETVGERSRNSKFSYVSPRSIYGETSNEYSDSSTYLCRSRAEAFK